LRIYATNYLQLEIAIRNYIRRIRSSIVKEPVSVTARTVTLDRDALQRQHTLADVLSTRSSS
jgi:hypothetical protein